MNLKELAIIVGTEIKINYNQNTNTYTCQLDHVEVKEGKKSGSLLTSWGRGATPEDAIADHCNDIAGKWLVYKAYDKEERMEFRVPKTLVG